MISRYWLVVIAAVRALRGAESSSPAPEERSTEAPGELAAYQVAFNEAVRAIEAQGRSLDELRSRSGIVISAGSLVAGFLGPTALEMGATPAAIIGTALLLVCVGLAIFVLLPSRGWRFVMGTRELLASYIETDPPATMSELYRSLAWHLEDDWDGNQAQLKRRYWLFAGSALAVAGETILLLAAIAQKGTL